MTEDRTHTYLKETFEQLISFTGEDINREGLQETPERAARAWAEWMSGYGKDPSEVLKTFVDGSAGYDELVFQGNISCYSHCEHHLAPFFGVVHIGYIPKGKVVGLSKLVRLVDIFAQRLQVQERLTVQVADTLMTALEPEGVGVVVQCRHLCMESRGVRKTGTVTTTSALLGSFREEPEVRSEFMGMVHAAKVSHAL